MADDPRAAAIVRSTISLAHSLGMRLVAEGVENEITAGHLADSGCDVSQGFYFSRALPAAELERWLDERGQRPEPAAAPRARPRSRHGGVRDCELRGRPVTLLAHVTGRADPRSTHRRARPSRPARPSAASSGCRPSSAELDRLQRLSARHRRPPDRRGCSPRSASRPTASPGRVLVREAGGRLVGAALLADTTVPDA